MLTDVLIQENILEQIQECFIKIDFKWNCLYANQKAIEFIEKPLNEVVGIYILHPIISIISFTKRLNIVRLHYQSPKLKMAQ